MYVSENSVHKIFVLVGFNELMKLHLLMNFNYNKFINEMNLT